MGREENVSVEGASTQLSRQMSELQCKNSCLSVASQVVGKMPKLAPSVGTLLRRKRPHLNCGFWR